MRTGLLSLFFYLSSQPSTLNCGMNFAVWRINKRFNSLLRIDEMALNTHIASIVCRSSV
jgi:hypothetical protein